jgi:hypothetical protein
MGRKIGRAGHRQACRGIFTEGSRCILGRGIHAGGGEERQAQAGMYTEAWRQKLAGKGRETGSQTQASKQASRMKPR